MGKRKIKESLIEEILHQRNLNNIWPVRFYYFSGKVISSCLPFSTFPNYIFYYGYSDPAFQFWKLKYENQIKCLLLYVIRQLGTYQDQMDCLDILNFKLGIVIECLSLCSMERDGFCPIYGVMSESGIL